MAKNKFKTNRERNEYLLKEITIFNSFVVKLRNCLNYRELQIEKEIDVEDEIKEKFNLKISELTDCIKIQKNNMELQFNIRLSDESIYYGILPELLLDYELKYFLDQKESKFKKINNPIQSNLVI